MKVNHWYHPKKAKLERVLRKKWEQENVKYLPIINVLLRKIIEGELVFDPTNYLDDKEHYFRIYRAGNLIFKNNIWKSIRFLHDRQLDTKKLYDIKKIF